MDSAGKTFEVQDKRTVRAVATRKARTNKINTARGPKDRRIRLSADIAIKFYDVQDRLGYERATEAVDWLINKAKGSIDELYERSFQQQNSAYQGNYLAESMLSREDVGVHDDILPESSREDYRAPSFHNPCSNISGYSSTMDSSVFLPYIQMENGSEDQCFAQSIFSSPIGLEHSSMPSFQQLEEKGQNSRMIMFDSKLNSMNGEHPFISNSVPLFLQPSNNDSSLFHTSRTDPELNLCLPGNCTSTFSDSEQVNSGTFFNEAMQL